MAFGKKQTKAFRDDWSLDDHKAVEAAADKLGINKREFVRLAINEKLEREQEK